MYTLDLIAEAADPAWKRKLAAEPVFNSDVNVVCNLKPARPAYPVRMAYLACPYSGTKEERQARYEMSAKVVAQLIKRGVPTFSPLVHSHALSEEQGVVGHKTWMPIDLFLLSSCKGLVILAADGYLDSHGVLCEYIFAKQCGFPVIAVGTKAFKL